MEHVGGELGQAGRAFTADHGLACSDNFAGTGRGLMQSAEVQDTAQLSAEPVSTDSPCSGTRRFAALTVPACTDTPAGNGVCGVGRDNGQAGCNQRVAAGLRRPGHCNSAVGEGMCKWN